MEQCPDNGSVRFGKTPRSRGIVCLTLASLQNQAVVPAQRFVEENALNQEP